MSLELAIVSDALTITTTLSDQKKGQKKGFVSAVSYLVLLDGSGLKWKLVLELTQFLDYICLNI